MQYRRTYQRFFPPPRAARPRRRSQSVEVIPTSLSSCRRVVVRPKAAARRRRRGHDGSVTVEGVRTKLYRPRPPAGRGRYSIITLLTIATGRPADADSRPAGVNASSTSPSRLTWSTPAGMVMRDRLIAHRRHGLDAAGTCAAGDPLVDVLRGSELGLHAGAIEQLALHGQHPDDRGVPGIAAAGPRLFLGIGVPVVEIEPERRVPGVRRDGDQHALRRVAAGDHEAILGAGAHACAEAFRTADFRRLVPWLHRHRLRLARCGAAAPARTRPLAPPSGEPRSPPSTSACRQYTDGAPLVSGSRRSRSAARQSLSSRAARSATGSAPPAPRARAAPASRPVRDPDTAPAR